MGQMDALRGQAPQDFFLPYDLDRKIMAIHLIIADACNMNCKYCFYYKKPKLMDEATAKATMDWLLSHSITDQTPEGKKPRPVHVTFFGGEPTLNEEVVMETVRYGNALARKLNKEVSFGVVSNFLDPSMDFLKFCADAQMGFLASYDGFHAQDINRRQGSNNKVLANMVRAMEMGIRINVAQQISPGNTAHIYDDLQSIFGMGVGHVFQNPVHHGIVPYNEEDFVNIENAFSKISAQIIKKRLAGVTNREWGVSNFEAHVMSILNLMRSDQNMTRFMDSANLDRTCGACKGSLAVAVDGTIRPCQQMTTEYDQWILGDVKGSEFRTDLRAAFRQEQFPECKECAVVKCAPCRTQNAYTTGSEFCVPDEVCRYQRLLFYHAVHIVNALADKAPEYMIKPPQRQAPPRPAAPAPGSRWKSAPQIGSTGAERPAGAMRTPQGREFREPAKNFVGPPQDARGAAPAPSATQKCDCKCEDAECRKHE